MGKDLLERLNLACLLSELCSQDLSVDNDAGDPAQARKHAHVIQAGDVDDMLCT